jgi:hypothetical protein
MTGSFETRQPRPLCVDGQGPCVAAFESADLGTEGMAEAVATCAMGGVGDYPCYGRTLLSDNSGGNQ